MKFCTTLSNVMHVKYNGNYFWNENWLYLALAWIVSVMLFTVILLSDLANISRMVGSSAYRLDDRNCWLAGLR